MLERAEIPLPEPPELRLKDPLIGLHDALGRKKISIPKGPMQQSDMRLFGQRLHAMAREAGVTGYEQTWVTSLKFDDERPSGLLAQRREGGEVVETYALNAKLIVDATGLGGHIRHQVKSLDRDCPEVPGDHLCDASQEVLELLDLEAGREFMRQMNAVPGECLVFLGQEGGFSTLNVQVEEEHLEVDILTGSTANGQFRSSKQLIANFIADKPWIGPVKFGGSGKIPMRRPYDRLGVPGCVVIGNAACQVFPAHASGIGVGQIAGKILAETVGLYRDPGSHEAVWRYQAAFQREIGCLLGAYDVFRRLSQSLSPDDLHFLFESEMMNATTTLSGLAQQMPDISPLMGLRIASGGIRNPALLAKFATATSKMKLVYFLYKSYPRESDERALQQWSRRVAFLFGEQPDIVR
jgi:flavin-dependent dehydrogenase